MPSRLNNNDYMSFPLQITKQGAAVSDRASHVRQQIEQILFTNPTERWYRPDFGIGVNALVFEPNNSALWELVKQRLLANLSQSLKNDVLPETLTVEVNGVNEQLMITINYQIAALQHTEKLQFLLGGEH